VRADLQPPTAHGSRRCVTRFAIDRSAYGYPLIIQAGGSPPGQELSARTADIVFSVVNGDKPSANQMQFLLHSERDFKS
jgi:alkanesulfonate monooxygenase SsuD/methylene tetrahydromethanopterin reductase-like flavin-dependent oxidoreductase (luciferase family)